MVTVIDSPCGYGKTSFAINMINDNPTKNFVYITPFLDEVGRVIDSTRYADGTPRLKQPTKEKTKMESLNRLLDNADDIASTHALFNRFCKKSPASIGGEMNCKYNLTSYLVYDKILLKRG